MDEPKPKKASPEGTSLGGPAAVRAPAKGDSSGSDVPRGEEGATFIEGPPTPAVDSNPAAGDVTYLDPSPTPAAGKPRLSNIFPKQNQLQTGDVLGGRFEILDILGEGGMGTVYKALDREVELTVALKLIRPEMAAHPAILARFKQELLTARQVTHKNVIRIHDLSEVDGVKFITMEFVEGCDLRKLLLDKGKLPPEEAVEIMRQVCLALEAAHSAGVIHRDLKPQNIMQDKQGRILVMDFGLARSLESDGMTQTGALLGTIEYMSPEQAMGKQLDARSDLFTVGLIFYELLTCKMPFKADTAMASLLKRNQERALPASEIDATIPKGLSDIVSKCLERDLNLRYQSAQEILEDLTAWQGKKPISASMLIAAQAPKRALPWKWIAVGTMAGLVLVGGWMASGKYTSKTGKVAAGPEVSLAILPFRNASTDLSLDWLGPSLADMLSTDVGQSAHLRTISPDRLHQVLSDLRITPGATIDSSMVERVAQFSNADTVVWGQYVRFGEQIRIDATLLDLKHNRLAPLKIEAANEKEIPRTVDGLAELIRKNLSLSSDVMKELKASSFQPNSSSVEALRDYNQGIGFQRDGKNLDARKQFEAATKADPNFALAFSKLAQTYSSLGYDSEAEQSAKKAVQLSQDLPEAEKYLISAIRSQVTKNYPDAISAYENLAKVSPGNSDVQSALASLYQDSGDLVKARSYYEKILSSNPKDVAATLDLGRIEIKSGNPQGSFDPLNRAYSLAVQVDNQEQKAASLHLTAVAYRMLGKPQEVLRNEREALTIWRHIGQKRGLAFSLNEMARAQASLGETKDALPNFQEALQIRREIGDKRGLGDTLIDMGNFSADRGDHDQALKMYKEALELEREIGNEGLQAACLNNIGSVYSEKGQYDDALSYFQQVLQLREKSKVPQDIVEAVHNLGEVSGGMGQYDKAISYYMRALDLRRSMNDSRGAATESYGLGILFGYQGRFGAAVNAQQDAVKTFRDLKDKTLWMVKILGGYGESLILAGRGDEAKGSLDEALSLSRELKNEGLVAETLGFQGDAYYYGGDFKSAHASYEQALQAATRSKQPDTILIAKANMAKVQVQEKRTQEAISSLRALIRQADVASLKYSSVECSILMAEAMMQSRDYAHARQELERALLLADKLGQQRLSVHAHYLLATIARNSANNTEARDNYREVIRTLDAMKKDAGAEKLLQRSDLRLMYEESVRWSQAGKS